MLSPQAQTSVAAGFRNAPYDVLDRIEAGALAKSKPR